MEWRIRENREGRESSDLENLRKRKAVESWLVERVEKWLDKKDWSDW